jgi:hypothetical protein
MGSRVRRELIDDLMQAYVDWRKEWLCPRRGLPALVKRHGGRRARTGVRRLARGARSRGAGLRRLREAHENSHLARTIARRQHSCVGAEHGA